MKYKLEIDYGNPEEMGNPLFENLSGDELHFLIYLVCKNGYAAIVTEKE